MGIQLFCEVPDQLSFCPRCVDECRPSEHISNCATSSFKPKPKPQVQKALCLTLLALQNRSPASVQWLSPVALASASKNVKMTAAVTELPNAVPMAADRLAWSQSWFNPSPLSPC